MLNTSPSLSIKRIGEGLIARAQLGHSLLSVRAADIAPHPSIRCSIVCTVDEVFRLRVSPTEVQWISPEYGVVYDVQSNVEWIIITS
jgi:hypothetical protein